jgi:uncharacterized protein
MVRLGYALHDDFLIDKAKSRLDAVVNRMNKNGILFMWWLDKNNPEHVKAAARNVGGEAQGWPIWANSLLGRAMTAYYAGSRDPRVLKALETAYSENMLWIQDKIAPVNIWPAFETYTWTGNEAIKKALTEFFNAHRIQTKLLEKPVRMIDAWYDRMPDERKPWYKQPDHGVRFNESTIPWAVGYLWTGDADYLKAPCRWYEVIERGDDGMQPHGLPVCDENSGPTGSLRGSETCNMSAYTWSQISLLRVSGQGRMADRVERAVFNAGPAAADRTFKTNVYLQTPNRTSRSVPGEGPFLYNTTHYPLCCTAAMNRFLPNFITHLWMATYDNGLAAVHYGPCKVSALVADRVPVEVECKTDYPFNEVINVAIKPAREAKFPLSFRIPGWCKTPEILLNGAVLNAAADAKGFVRVERLWKPGDAVRLRFPMTVQVKMGRDNNAADTPYASVSYGPLLFALGIPDTADANTPDEAFKWNYALDVQGEKPEFGVEVERGPMPDRWGWQFDSPIKLRVRARNFDWNPAVRKALDVNPVAMSDASPFQSEAVFTQLPREPVDAAAAPEQLRLIPYGCTKFRVSMFPVTQQAFQTLEAKDANPASK